MGIEWARCQPSPATEPTDPPPWDEAALDHYADMVGTLIDQGMQPIARAGGPATAGRVDPGFRPSGEPATFTSTEDGRVRALFLGGETWRRLDPVGDR